MKRYLEAGQIVRPHGVRGELVLEPWADSAEFLLDASHFWFDGEGARDAGLLSSRVHKGRLLLRLKGVDTVEKAEALRGKILWLDREEMALPEGSHFVEDLIGLRAVDADSGRVYGELQEVLPTGANDVWRIRDQTGKDWLFPAVEHMIARIAPQDGVIELRPIPGIFDEEAQGHEN